MRATDPAAPGTRARQSTLTPNAWVAIVFTASLIVGGLGFAGIPGLLLVLGTVGFATAAYSLVTGRRSWALFPSRTLAAFVLAGCLASTTVGATLRHPPEALTTTAGIAASAGTTNLTADEAPNDATALTLLATLLVKGKAPKTGYDRTGQFGTAWLDVDRNGCDTRNDILARDLTAIDRPGNCTVLTGTLQEPYTGRAIRFVRGNNTSALVQIDHVVALSNAWQTGAQQLSPAQRVALANDPVNLLAVDGAANSRKGDSDSATWLPPAKSFRCAYIARQISVKAAYGLWVTRAERDAMAHVLSTCPKEPASVSALAAASIPGTPVAPSDAFTDCAAARAAGAAPVHRGNSGYGRHLDGDNDGTGCE